MRESSVTGIRGCFGDDRKADRGREMRERGRGGGRARWGAYNNESAHVICDERSCGDDGTARLRGGILGRQEGQHEVERLQFGGRLLVI